MCQPTEHFPKLLKLINLKSKLEVTRHCKNLTIHSQDFAAFILAAQQSVFYPYNYENHFIEHRTPHLTPTKAEVSAFEKNGIGEIKSLKAKKYISKVFQLFEERRTFAAHLLYTPNHKYWHLFFFDNGDTKKFGNHWNYGSHIHYISDLWGTVSLEEAWSQIMSGKVSFNKVHIKYKR